jgi:hypothetical protein
VRIRSKRPSAPAQEEPVEALLEERSPAHEPTDAEVEAELRARAAEARAAFLELCRNDDNAFCEYVLRDDESGEPVEQNAFHVELHDALTSKRRVVVMSHPESGKTSQLIGRVLRALGRNPNLRVMLLYASEDAAKKTLGAIKRYIEESEALHSVFPALTRGPIWQDDAITVARTAFSKDPSVVAVGYNSRRIQGSRVDLLVIDDLLDANVTATESQRKKLAKWVKNTVFTRLTANAMVAFLTNAWHPRDLAHELTKSSGWHLIKRPILNPDKSISWPERWTEERLRQVKRDLGSLEYARSFECDPRDDEARVFRPEHVDRALERGEGYGFVSRLQMMPKTIVVTGVDLAAAVSDEMSTEGRGAQKKGGKTAITSVFFHPNGDRQVLRIRSGRWRASQILDNLAAVAQAYPDNHWIVVENNGVQRWILDLARDNGVEVGVALVPFTTGRNKTDPRFGVASLAAEFEREVWILPSDCQSEDDANEVEELVSALIDYVPEAHTADVLMSLWFAREVGRKIWTRFYGKDSANASGSAVHAIG